MNSSTNVSLSLPEAWADYAVPDYTAYTTLVACGLILAVGLFGNLMVVIVVALTGKVRRLMFESGPYFWLLYRRIQN